MLSVTKHLSHYHGRLVAMIFVAVLLGCGYAFRIQAASISCANLGKTMKINTSCTTSCDSGSINFTDMFLSSSDIKPGELCPGTQVCCGAPGPGLCEYFGSKLKLASAVCRAYCQTNETSLDLQGSTNICGQSQGCCVPGQVSVNASSLGSMVAEDANPPAPALSAKSGTSGGAQALPDPLGGIDFPMLVGSVIRTFIGISGSIALLMFVYGGIRYIISGGKESEVSASKQILVNASIGIVLIFMAYLFVNTIINAILAS